MSEEWAKMLYVREVTLQYYGEPEPFGKYDQETKELTIMNEHAMGTLTREWVQAYCDGDREAGSLGSHVLFGVSQKAWELREKVRYRDQYDL